MIMNCVSNITSTNPRSKSVRTTIPPEIVKTLKLEAGDKLDWKLGVDDNQELIIIVEKSEE